MSKTRFFQILFSLAVIAALTLAIAPAPVYALSASTSGTAISASAAAHVVSALATAPNALVCRTVVRRHNGHIIVIRYCYRIENAI